MINFNNLQKCCPEQQYAKLRKLSQTTIVIQIARNDNTQHSKNDLQQKIARSCPEQQFAKKNSLKEQLQKIIRKNDL